MHLQAAITGPVHKSATRLIIVVLMVLQRVLRLVTPHITAVHLALERARRLETLLIITSTQTKTLALDWGLQPPLLLSLFGIKE